MNGNDVTHAFELGAEHALALCKQHNIHFALLKEGSPSCGNKQVHDGNFQHRKVPGQGITTRKLKQHGIQVFNENELNILLKLIQENVKMHPFQV